MSTSLFPHCCNMSPIRTPHCFIVNPICFSWCWRPIPLLDGYVQNICSITSWSVILLDWCSVVVGHREPGMKCCPVYTKGGVVAGAQTLSGIRREPDNQFEYGHYGKVHFQMTETQIKVTWGKKKWLGYPTGKSKVDMAYLSQMLKWYHQEYFCPYFAFLCLLAPFSTPKIDFSIWQEWCLFVATFLLLDLWLQK